MTRFRLLSFSLPFRGRAGVGASGLRKSTLSASAACPHPNLPPEGEGAMP
ncbi:hypothetical protein J2W34_006079 [Variovorax boronicumulans]|jgi:hypothetical protein|nr:hypothetical protein [Variovorax boronicumulans]